MSSMYDIRNAGDIPINCTSSRFLEPVTGQDNHIKPGNAISRMAVDSTTTQDIPFALHTCSLHPSLSCSRLNERVTTSAATLSAKRRAAEQHLQIKGSASDKPQPKSEKEAASLTFGHDLAFPEAVLACSDETKPRRKSIQIESHQSNAASCSGTFNDRYTCVPRVTKTSSRAASRQHAHPSTSSDSTHYPYYAVVNPESPPSVTSNPGLFFSNESILSNSSYAQPRRGSYDSHHSSYADLYPSPFNYSPANSQFLHLSYGSIESYGSNCSLARSVVPIVLLPSSNNDTPRWSLVPDQLGLNSLRRSAPNVCQDSAEIDRCDKYLRKRNHLGQATLNCPWEYHNRRRHSDFVPFPQSAPGSQLELQNSPPQSNFTRPTLMLHRPEAALCPSNAWSERRGSAEECLSNRFRNGRTNSYQALTQSFGANRNYRHSSFSPKFRFLATSRINERYNNELRRHSDLRDYHTWCSSVPELYEHSELLQSAGDNKTSSYQDAQQEQQCFTAALSNVRSSDVDVSCLHESSDPLRTPSISNLHRRSLIASGAHYEASNKSTLECPKRPRSGSTPSPLTLVAGLDPSSYDNNNHAFNDTIHLAAASRRSIEKPSVCSSSREEGHFVSVNSAAEILQPMTNSWTTRSMLLEEESSQKNRRGQQHSASAVSELDRNPILSFIETNKHPTQQSDYHVKRSNHNWSPRQCNEQGSGVGESHAMLMSNKVATQQQTAANLAETTHMHESLGPGGTAAARLRLGEARRLPENHSITSALQKQNSIETDRSCKLDLRPDRLTSDQRSDEVSNRCLAADQKGSTSVISALKDPLACDQYHQQIKKFPSSLLQESQHVRSKECGEKEVPEVICKRPLPPPPSLPVVGVCFPTKDQRYTNYCSQLDDGSSSQEQWSRPAHRRVSSSGRGAMLPLAPVSLSSKTVSSAESRSCNNDNIVAGNLRQTSCKQAASSFEGAANSFQSACMEKRVASCASIITPPDTGDSATAPCSGSVVVDRVGNNKRNLSNINFPADDTQSTRNDKLVDCSTDSCYSRQAGEVVSANFVACSDNGTAAAYIKRGDAARIIASSAVSSDLDSIRMSSFQGGLGVRSGSEAQLVQHSIGPLPQRDSMDLLPPAVNLTLRRYSDTPLAGVQSIGTTRRKLPKPPTDEKKDLPVSETGMATGVVEGLPPRPPEKTKTPRKLPRPQKAPVQKSESLKCVGTLKPLNFSDAQIFITPSSPTEENLPKHQTDDGQQWSLRNGHHRSLPKLPADEDASPEKPTFTIGCDDSPIHTTIAPSADAENNMDQKAAPNFLALPGQEVRNESTEVTTQQSSASLEDGATGRVLWPRRRCSVNVLSPSGNAANKGFLTDTYDIGFLTQRRHSRQEKGFFERLSATRRKSSIFRSCAENLDEPKKKEVEFEVPTLYKCSLSSSENPSSTCLSLPDSIANAVNAVLSPEQQNASTSGPKNAEEPLEDQPQLSMRRKSAIIPKVSIGKIGLTVQYFPVRKRLRISINKAENLGGVLRPEKELNVFVKLYLEPGKIQKQRSRVVKRTRDAIINEEFYFDNVLEGDVKTKTLVVKVYHSVERQLQKKEIIGLIEQPLKEVPSILNKKAVELFLQLRAKQNKKLGRIQFGLCVEPKDRRLTVNVIKAEDLPKYGISGAPDPCIKITVDQGGHCQTKQTRALKKTCNPVYKESVMFLIKSQTAILPHTKIVVSVIDTARSATGDDVIGEVHLGALATEKLELEQWKNVLESAGKEAKATHVLKPPLTELPF